MTDGYSLTRRTPEGALRRGPISEVLPAWRGVGEERWLFFAPHDDDLAIGGGQLLTVAAGEELSIRARIVTDGRMGYTSVTGPDEIVAVRREETEKSFSVLGVSDVAWYGYPDAQLGLHLGRRRAIAGDPHDVAGYSGLQNSFTAELREYRPSRVFVLSAADYHPDHKQVHQELLISLFHAAGDIWPELGEPLEDVPHLYELATYSPFSHAPDLELRTDHARFADKLAAIGEFVSQAQIQRLLAGVKRAGPVEYIRTVPFVFYDPREYAPLFEDPSG